MIEGPTYLNIETNIQQCFKLYLKTEQGDSFRPACRRNSLDQNPCLTPGGFCSRVGHAVAVAMGDNQFEKMNNFFNEYFEKKIESNVDLNVFFSIIQHLIEFSTYIVQG